MKISLNWLKEYINITDSPEKVSEILTDTGLEVEGLEKIESIQGGLKGLVVGKVLTCERHPNADKLSITTVDIGSESPSPIVCGAPNVAVGQTVVVATVGTTLYPTSGEPFKIKKAKIRGEVSEGMICAEDEIGLGKGHDGILVLEKDIKAGTPASDVFELQDDYVIEIGLTPNRADGTSHIGVARDLKAAYLSEVQWPSTDAFAVDNTSRSIPVEVENNEACPRYSAVTISGIQVSKSPEWLRTRLSSIGLSPINNIVDITNFVLHEMGQPLHAFDADETGGRVIVKTLPSGSNFITLDEVERKLAKNDLMICDASGNGMCIAGVFGGINSGVSEKTNSIFLESAYFAPDYIRKTAQSHGLKTDASFRFERGTDPNLTVIALKRAAMLIKEIAGGEISSEIVDIYPSPIPDFHVPVKYSNIDRLIGKSIDTTRIKEILTYLDIKVTEETENGFLAIVPPYRVDVQREADVIEEILRIFGFNNVELPTSISSDFLADFPANDPNRIQRRISETLAGVGFFEILTNSLTKPEYTRLGGNNSEEDVVILNKLSEDLGIMKQSMLYTGLEVLSHNINRRQNNLKTFEFGKTYKLIGGKYKEQRKLAMLMTGNASQENWSQKNRSVEFHDLFGEVQIVTRQLMSKQISKEPAESSDEYDYALNLIVDSKIFGTLGKVSKKVQKHFGIKQDIFYADLDWDLLLKKTNDNIVYQEVSKFPEVRRDLSLVIDKSISFEQIRLLASKTETNILKELNVFDVYEGDKIESNKKAYSINFSLQDQNKTLTDKVIDKTMARLMKAFETNLDAIIRQ